MMRPSSSEYSGSASRSSASSITRTSSATSFIKRVEGRRRDGGSKHSSKMSQRSQGSLLTSATQHSHGGRSSMLSAQLEEERNLRIATERQIEDLTTMLANKGTGQNRVPTPFPLSKMSAGD